MWICKNIFAYLFIYLIYLLERRSKTKQLCKLNFEGMIVKMSVKYKNVSIASGALKIFV